MNIIDIFKRKVTKKKSTKRERKTVKEIILMIKEKSIEKED